ncbi:PREDICTED: probable serine/threonine-protein kinase Cx32, chloroplastic isoform X2 [Camelina sativa]|uniref:Probable serine/threonine-protein kinase Cx32, chloroplastic isoform X2 n=1 Tax=Camelina sativa TaxID=90675 RepID=A0ABM0U8C5_CAMSA|nr:PREDICTED: probable serine/threonine-protein kinase Cx32, chloroplastic isoform X2 [Camelina sativa]
MGACCSIPSKTGLRSHGTTNGHSSASGTEFSSMTTTTAATTSSSVGRRSQFSEAASECSNGIISDSGLILESPNLKVYTFLDLKTATKNFKPDSMLGQGGFGKVYRGWVDAKTLSPSKAGSGVIVAIKRLNSESVQGFAEWRSEVNFLGMLSHPNLVKLLGYCREDKELLLVYEFMPRGSLENHLFRRNEPFPWELRIKIAIGAARGLAFLHGLQREVIYRDFKASNILLDSTYDAKISDFGLAKLGPADEKSHVTTRVMGTYGYAAPEYMATGHLYVKSDVYAFGVVLLEVMTGLKAHNIKRPRGQESLVDWLRPELSSKHRVKQIMDKGIKGQYTTKVATEMARITLSCIEPDPKNRPHMKDVVDVLENIRKLNVVPDCSSTKQAVSSSSRASPLHHQYGYRAGALGLDRKRASAGRFGVENGIVP